MKKYKVRINHFAQNDIEKAKKYYNDKKKGLGNEFWQETKALLNLIEKNPNQFQIIIDETRRANLKRFPFGIFYVAKNFIVNVFGVIHFSRSPELWQKRVENIDNTDD